MVNDKEAQDQVENIPEEELAEEDSEEDYYEDEDEDYQPEEEDEDEDEDPEVTQITETITVVKQPIITSVFVSCELDSKGVIKPACKASIERHIDPDEIETDEFEIISNDFLQLATEVEIQVKKLKEALNK